MYSFIDIIQVYASHKVKQITYACTHTYSRAFRTATSIMLLSGDLLFALAEAQRYIKPQLSTNSQMENSHFSLEGLEFTSQQYSSQVRPLPGSSVHYITHCHIDLTQEQNM